MNTAGANWLNRLSAFLAVTLWLLTIPGSMGAELQGNAGDAITALASDKAGGQLFKLQGRLLFDSKDGGQSWSKIPLPKRANSILAVAVSADGSALYAAGPGLGVVQTKAGATNWIAADEGLPTKNVTAFAAHATQPATIYAFVALNGIFRSQNAGKDWRKMDRGPEDAQQMIHTNMAGSMDSGWLYVVTPKGVRLSMDCFCLWRDLTGINEQIGAVAFDPEQPDHVFAVSPKGILRSVNGGQDWELAGTPRLRITAMTVVASGVIYVGTENGELYRSRDGAKTWELAGA